MYNDERNTGGTVFLITSYVIEAGTIYADFTTYEEIYDVYYGTPNMDFKFRNIQTDWLQHGVWDYYDYWNLYTHPFLVPILLGVRVTWIITYPYVLIDNHAG